MHAIHGRRRHGTSLSARSVRGLERACRLELGGAADFNVFLLVDEFCCPTRSFYDSVSMANDDDTAAQADGGTLEVAVLLNFEWVGCSTPRSCSCSMPHVHRRLPVRMPHWAGLFFPDDQDSPRQRSPLGDVRKT